MARADGFTQKLGDEIVARLSDGEPLRAICRDEHMPTWRTIYRWMESYPEFASAIARGRELGQEAIFEDTLHIADTPLIGEETEESENGLKVKRGDMLGHRKLQIETRLKLLAKWNPKRYGERVQQDVTVTQNLTDDQLDAKIAELSAATDGDA